ADVSISTHASRNEARQGQSGRVSDAGVQRGRKNEQHARADSLAAASGRIAFRADSLRTNDKDALAWGVAGDRRFGQLRDISPNRLARPFCRADAYSQSRDPKRSSESGAAAIYRGNE